MTLFRHCAIVKRRGFFKEHVFYVNVTDVIFIFWTHYLEVVLVLPLFLFSCLSVC